MLHIEPSIKQVSALIKMGMTIEEIFGKNIAETVAQTTVIQKETDEEFTQKVCQALKEICKKF